MLLHTRGQSSGDEMVKHIMHPCWVWRKICLHKLLTPLWNLIIWFAYQTQERKRGARMLVFFFLNEKDCCWMKHWGFVFCVSHQPIHFHLGGSEQVANRVQSEQSCWLEKWVVLCCRLLRLLNHASNWSRAPFFYFYFYYYYYYYYEGDGDIVLRKII